MFVRFGVMMKEKWPLATLFRNIASVFSQLKWIQFNEPMSTSKLISFRKV